LDEARLVAARGFVLELSRPRLSVCRTAIAACSGLKFVVVVVVVDDVDEGSRRRGYGHPAAGERRDLLGVREGMENHTWRVSELAVPARNEE
jgi:hypothetical protein